MLCINTIYILVLMLLVLHFPKKNVLEIAKYTYIYSTLNLGFLHLTQPLGSSLPLLVHLGVNGHS